jgi:hypothetical protein
MDNEDPIFPHSLNHDLDSDALAREVLKLSQQQRTVQRWCSTKCYVLGQHKFNTNEQFDDNDSSSISNMNVPYMSNKDNIDANQNKEIELERPDWSAHFADTPLSIMEESARKSMIRGATQSPAWESWRADLKEEGKEMASQWGGRDKSTRPSVPPQTKPLQQKKITDDDDVVYKKIKSLWSDDQY